MLGQAGQAFYFVLSGTVIIKVQKDHGTGLMIEDAINEMHGGDSFGELALLDPHNVRTASVICKVCDEVLCVCVHACMRVCMFNDEPIVMS